MFVANLFFSVVLRILFTGGAVVIWLRLCVFSLIYRPIMPLFSVVSRQTNFPHINISTPCFIMTKNHKQKNKLHLRLQVNQYAKWSKVGFAIFSFYRMI